MFETGKSESVRRQCLIFSGLATLIVLMPFGGCLYLAVNMPDFNGQPHQPDSQMITRFQQQRNDFERLRQMVIEDKGLTRVDEDWTEPQNPETIGLTAARIAEYRKLFQQLGTPRGFSATKDRQQIEFIVSSQGWVAHGSLKSYAYLLKRPEEVLESLDGLSLGKRPFGTGYRHIEGNWYLYFNGN